MVTCLHATHQPPPSRNNTHELELVLRRISYVGALPLRHLAPNLHGTSVRQAVCAHNQATRIAIIYEARSLHDDDHAQVNDRHNMCCHELIKEIIFNHSHASRSVARLGVHTCIYTTMMRGASLNHWQRELPTG